MSRKNTESVVRKNQIISLQITGMTAEGNGVGHFYGLAVFVPQSAIDDMLEVRIVKVQSHFAYGIIEKIVVPSPDRIEPDCPHFQKCGGCLFRHISYEAECRIKTQFVKDTFTRIGHLDAEEVLPIFEAPQLDACRNKAQYPCGMMNDKICFGFYAPRSHRLIPISDCRLQPSVFADIMNYCIDLLERPEYRNITPYNEENGSGVLRHIYLRQGYHSHEIMICFISAKDTASISSAFKEIGQSLMEKFTDVKSVMLNVNTLNTNVILGKQTYCLCGEARIQDTLCGIPVSLSPQSFYQVNTVQAERLFAEAKRLANPQKNDLLLDLYCGAGAIGLSMSDAVQKVIGVEIVPQAIEDAKKNAKCANIQNASFYTGDAGQIATQFAQNNTSPDIIVLDPPRKGCDISTLDACLQMNPSRIVMISCNPATAARDASYLCQNGYSLKILRPADFFPRTGHVETVVLMSKVNTVKG